MLRGRPIVGLGLAVVLVGAAYFGSEAIDGLRQERITNEAVRSARESTQRARDLIGVQVETVALMGTSAVVNPRLEVMLRGRVDAKTLSDVFASESWWEPYRGLGTAISYEGTDVAFAGGEGMSGLPLGELVSAARAADGAVSKVVAGTDRPFAVSATPMRFSGDVQPAILVLAKPFDRPTLDALMDRAKAPLLLTDGKRSLASVGAPGDVRLLQAALGREREGRYTLQDTAWAAAASEIAPGLWLWAGARVGGYARTEAGEDADKKRWLWVGTVTFGVVLFGMSLRRRADADLEQEDDDYEHPATSRGERRSAEMPNATRDPVPRIYGSPTTGPQGEGEFGAPVGVGTPLGRYVLLDRIGEGGMAEVFTAVSYGSGGFRRSFVIKRLRAEMNANPVAVSHFIDEANLASTLVHPNIVPVFDFGEVGGSYFIAQEYIVGRDLGRLSRRMIERHMPPVSAGTALYIAHETLRGLHYAHERRGDDGSALELVHRDVTPENVMVSERGEVKILDFGIVKATSQRVSQTDIGMVKGNVDYMSPEQARGRTVDRRSDVFSVGLVLYFAVTRRPLYQGDTLYDRLTRAAVGPGDAELAAVAALPAPLPAVLGRALAIDPGERYQTATEFAHAIAPHVLGGAAELTGVVNALFGDELQLEQDRLAAAFPRRGTREQSIAADRDNKS